MAEARILIVSSDASTADAVRAVLEAQGYAVRVAPSLREALAEGERAERDVTFVVRRPAAPGARPDAGPPGPPEGVTAAPAPLPTLNLAALEREAIHQALQATGWNKQAAAARLGLHRPTLYSKMRKHGIPQKRPS
jgi:DNA-binding NtrC family response regulator